MGIFLPIGESAGGCRGRRDTESTAVSRGGWRLLASTGLAMLVLTWMPPASALGREAPSDTPFAIASPNRLIAESSAKTSITLGLEVLQTDAEELTMLELHGRRTAANNSAPFKVSVPIARVPCPGSYLFTAGQEDTLNGNTVTYTALIRLFDPDARPAGARCGVRPPQLPGRLEMILSTPERNGHEKKDTFLLEAEREGTGPFGGTLTFKQLPECRDYRLRTALDLDGWERVVDFKVQILEFKWTFQGREVKPQRC